MVLKEDKEFATSGKQKDSVREETNAVSGTTGMSVQNRHGKTTPSSEPPTQGTSAAGVRVGKPTVQRLHERYLNHLVTIGILPNVSFYKSESGCKIGDKCSLPHWKVEEQPNEKPKKGGDTSAVAILKHAQRHKSLGINSTSAIHKSYAASC